MVFKKMMRAFGVGGPSVDTVPTNPNTRPGLALQGQVHVLGGDHDVTIEQIALGLVTRVESEHGDRFMEFHRLSVADRFTLSAGEGRDLPFAFPMPWETPVTHVYGQRLNGMTMGLRTELAIAKSVDKGDLDELAVHPLPAQEKILEAFDRLGFRFTRADLEQGAIYGVRQELPFYQEIEFFPPQQYAGAINEVELTFVADPQGVEVILEFDKRGGLLHAGHDTFGRFRVPHEEVDSTDWAAVLDARMREASGRPAGMQGHGIPGAAGAFAGGPGSPGHGSPGYGYVDHGYAGHGGGGRGGGGRGMTGHGRGPGVGAMAAGVAGGVVGGMILGEVVEEVFEDDEGDFDE